MDTLFSLLFFPTLALLVLGLALAPLGCFLTWRRLAFFGDGLSHACTFGIAVALLLKIHFLIGISITAVSIGILLILLEKKKTLSIDTFFSILSYAFFSGGILALSFSKNLHISVEDVLFGDFLAIQSFDFWITLALVSIVLIFLLITWPTLVLLCLSQDLAIIRHKDARHVEILFIILTSLTVAFGMSLIGALLLPALMILPAATARFLSTHPRQMMIVSAGMSTLGCSLGIAASYIFKTPTSPTMVLASAGLFVLTLLLPQRISHV